MYLRYLFSAALILETLLALTFSVLAYEEEAVSNGATINGQVTLKGTPPI